MKNFLFALLLFPFLANSQTQATLLYNWDDPTIVGSNSYDNAYNEIWGVVANDKEFAVIGSTKGTHFFDLTAANPQELTNAFVVPGEEGGVIIHRDYHDYQCYLYAVADEGQGSTLQIIDYSDLPNSTTVVYDSNVAIKRAHNIFIDTAQAVMYAVFVDNATTNRQNLMVFSLANPIAPTHIATHNSIQGQSIGGAHDVYVRDGIAYLNCGNNNGLVIADFNNPANPVFLGEIDSYPGQGYNHSGWLSDDGNYYFLADETHNTPVKVLNVSDPANIQFITTIDAGPGASTFSIPHNIIIRGNYAYVSYYYDGLVVYDFTNPSSPTRVVSYDTYSGPNTQNYKGAWGVFPYLPSGNILVSDMQTGLYVFEKIDQSITGVYPPLGSSANCGIPVSNNSEVSPVNSVQITPHPVSDRATLSLELKQNHNVSIQLVDLTGKTVQLFNRYDLTEGENSIELEIESAIASGMYILQVSGEEFTYSEKLIISK